MILLLDLAFLFVVLLWFGVAAFAVEKDMHGLLALLILCVLGYFLITVGFSGVATWISIHFSLLIGGFVLYTIVGVFWSFFKWDRFVADKASMKLYKPEWTDYKLKLTTWIIYWPFSVINYVFGKMINDLYTWIINKLGSVYSTITNRHYKTVTINIPDKMT